ncbi:MAG: glycosyltransferase family 4 protein [Bacteroidales bacterium]|nr:glycosyltransferase family 4 protein [Bacteroidales bacterium]MCM1414567.1 glycosyltransferase family 4 protein [bacterium]MCM1422617.1 glycosyltransferase family 4 protein [bacterium]
MKALHVCMIVPNEAVKGGIASVVNGYRGSALEERCRITYIESYRDGSKWQKFCKALQGYRAFRRLLRTDRPDLLHIHSSFGPSFYRKMPFILWSAARGIPVVNHIHGAEFEAFYEKASEAKRRRIRRIYAKCTRLIALSAEWADRLEKIVPRERIDILSNYCRIPSEPCDADRNKKQMLFLGELGERKGCFDIPEILERVRERCPEVKLVMAGDGEMARVKDAFLQKGLLDAVCFPGWVQGEEKEKLLRESGIFLFPSYHEGMPVAVLEAMAYGMGIVTTTVGGIPQLIRDGESGALVSPGDMERMAAAAERFLTDEAYLAACGRAARARAISEYSLESHLEKLSEIYQRACQESGR